MKKIADIIAFLFLASLSTFTGFIVITAQAQLGSTSNQTAENIPTTSSNAVGTSELPLSDTTQTTSETNTPSSAETTANQAPTPTPNLNSNTLPTTETTQNINVVVNNLTEPNPSSTNANQTPSSQAPADTVNPINNPATIERPEDARPVLDTASPANSTPQNLNGGRTAPLPPQVRQNPTDILTYYQRECISAGILDSRQCERYLAVNLDPECKAANIQSPQECELYLKQRYLPILCQRQNAATDKTCAEELVNRYTAELSCGNLTPDECKTVAAQNLSGFIASGLTTRELINDAVQRDVETSLTPERLLSLLNTRGLPINTIPLTALSTARLSLVPAKPAIAISSPVSAEVLSRYLIVIDTDNDGLPDDLEARYGSNPLEPDSDGDGFFDGAEVANGYSPIHSDNQKLTTPISAGERALLTGQPLAQPHAGNIASPELMVTSATTRVEAVGLVLTGKTIPNSTALLYIYSHIPLVLIVTSDAEGTWTYTLAEPMVEGKHTVYVAILSDAGTLEKQSNPFTFFIRSAEAVTPTTFLGDEAIGAAEITNPYARYYLYGGISIIAVGLIAALFIVIARRHTDAGHA